MTQASNTGSTANLNASSTPIRIGSYHGPHTGSSAVGVTGNDSPSAVSQTQQSSSVPSAAGHLGSSNHSLGGGGGGATSVTPPNSAGLRQSAGIVNWTTDNRDRYDGSQNEKTPSDTSKLNRKESYKAQRKNYRREKKRVASELLNRCSGESDPAVIVLADWLKVRGTLKSWTKLWCVLKPGLLLIYKSHKTKSSNWVGTVLLTSCQVIERPSKKDGFCFKLFHPMEQSIWAPRGPDRETIGAVVQPLPTSYLIFRAPSQAAGKCWMDALELSLRCSALLLRSNSNSGTVQGGSNAADSAQISHETQWSEADYERHFNDHGLHSSGADCITQNLLTLPPPMAKLHRRSSSGGQSDASRSQTPIFQHLYTTMINWEENILANTREFQKIKKMPKFCKGGKTREASDAVIEGGGSTGELSYSDDNSGRSPRLPAHESLKLKIKRRRLNPFGKFNSLGAAPLPAGNSTTSSDEDDNKLIDCLAAAKASFAQNIGGSSVRRVSAPPFILNVKDLDADSQNEGATALMSGLESDSDSDPGDEGGPDVTQMNDPIETIYVPLVEEEFSEQAGEQVEELAEENKSLIWMLVKQVRPGMDLSKVVLPTFILEPRSFLDKLSDSYYHADILAKAVLEDDPFTRMKTVVKWYLSGFYKKPRGLKKPYNPILGETFRCYWEHPDNSRTYYIAEQVSHHPPISAFYVTNRQDGFCISCSILAKSKFYGNSTSAVLEGVATMTLLPRGESYTLTTPYAHCKGILVGTLSMELGGKINIECENTGYKTELEFKLKPFLGGSESTNMVIGKIKLGKETLATVNGHWDSEMRMKDVKSGEESVLFTVNNEMKQTRLTRHVVPIESQLQNESERMWQLVSAAIRSDDQVGATEEKTVLEEAQRSAARERKATFTEWVPSHFQQDMITGQWIYKYADLRPWDMRSDVCVYESDYRVLTKTRHQAPMVRTASMISGDRLALLKNKRKSQAMAQRDVNLSDSSASNDNLVKTQISSKSIRKLMLAIDQVNKALDDHTHQLQMIQLRLDRMQYAPQHTAGANISMASLPSISSALLTNVLRPTSLVASSVLYAVLGLIVCLSLKWVFK